MKRLHLFAVVSSASMFLTGVLVACSTEDTIITNDAGTPDAIGALDSGTDATTDTGTDAPTVDAGFTVDSYADAISDTLCNALTRCCYGDSDVPNDGGLDGGTFDRTRCLNIYEALGFEASNAGLNITRSNIVVNQAKANECLTKVDSLACELTGASLKEIRSACFGAFEGQLQAGADCKASLECASGNYCKPSAADGGTDNAGNVGKCAPLVGEGGNCSVINTGTETEQKANDSYAAEVACSSRGGGDTGLACASYTATDWKDDRDEWTCQPAVANGEVCNTTVSCANGICNPESFLCEEVATYFTNNICASYVHKQ